LPQTSGAEIRANIPDLLSRATDMFTLRRARLVLLALVAATTLAVFYTQWSSGFPWDWAHSQRSTRSDLVLLFCAWLVLVGWSAEGMRRLTEAVRGAAHAGGDAVVAPTEQPVA
jgi:hypothetical protein